MRCTTCGRLIGNVPPAWALKCRCRGGPVLEEHGTASLHELVAAIREDELVGRGSCSSIDECWNDEDLREALLADGVGTRVGAVAWARCLEQTQLERACDARWGEDDDPQLLALQEFKAKL